jgi:hypothetical protein
MKIIEMPHRVCEYSCPINGLEDLYERKTGHRLPDYFLFYLSTIGFTYLKNKRASLPKTVFWGNGVGKPQHDFLADVMGYRWSVTERTGFATAFNRCKQSVDRDRPVILGLLDMYHLPYFKKIYHQVHIPQHFTLMVGYDDERQRIFVQDNSREEVQTVPYDDLKSAWDVNVPGQGKKNTAYFVEFEQSVPEPSEIIRKGLRKRAAWFLHPPVGFMGLPGLKRLAGDFPAWKEEMGPALFADTLRHFVTFTCSVVPMLPQRLSPGALETEDPHQACRDRFSSLLCAFADEYRRPAWKKSAALFEISGEYIRQLTETLVDFLLAIDDRLASVPDILQKISSCEEEAFKAILENED